MLYKVVEVSTDKASGHTYVLVHFWRRKAGRGAPPDRINDFLMQLRATGEKLANSDKPELGSVTFDRVLPAEIKANIEAYWVRAEAKNFPADHTSQAIQRDNSDPHGILAQSDVMALEDSKVEKP